MKPLESTGLTLEAQLRTEVRACPRCKFEISNPFIERCPRCLTAVPVNDPGCSKCVHNSSCPVASVKEKA